MAAGARGSARHIARSTYAARLAGRALPQLDRIRGLDRSQQPTRSAAVWASEFRRVDVINKILFHLMSHRSVAELVGKSRFDSL